MIFKNDKQKARLSGRAGTVRSNLIVQTSENLVTQFAKAIHASVPIIASLNGYDAIKSKAP